MHHFKEYISHPPPAHLSAHGCGACPSLCSCTSLCCSTEPPTRWAREGCGVGFTAWATNSSCRLGLSGPAAGLRPL